MAPFTHSNFAVDHKLDKLVNKNFEKMVTAMMKNSNLCRHVQDVEEKRRIAVDEVLNQTAEWKLKRKRKEATKNKNTKGVQKENQGRGRRKDNSLLQKCLTREFRKRVTEERRLKGLPSVQSRKKS